MTSVVAPAVLQSFAVSDADFVAETQIARVWRVRQSDGTPAALKVYHTTHMGNEASGIHYLQNRHKGAVHIYNSTENAVLMEWLDGPHLGDMSRAGEDASASHHLLEVAQALHSAPPGDTSRYPKVSDWLSDLFTLNIARDCPVVLKRDMQRCQSLAKTMLADPQDHIPLHGDLHHDNIRQGPRGFCAFDAKGVIGERGYELANAFRNPKGAPALLRDPDRIASLAELWAEGLGVERKRLQTWAAIKCALSIAWQARGVLHDSAESDLLSLLLKDV